MTATAGTAGTEPSLEAVSPALEPPPGNPRFPLVDGVRAVAVLAIVVYHVGYASQASSASAIGPLFSRLHIGVTIFFVVSGFLLYRPFVAARRGHGPPIGVRGYARRRLLRIVPAYWVALTLLAIWPGLPGVFTGHWWVYYGFLQVYSTDTFLQGIGPTWSLATEMSFYVVLPLYAFGLARLTRAATTAVWVRRELVCLAALSAAVFAFRAWQHGGGGLRLPPGTLLSTFDWFAIGMGLAVASVALGEAEREPRTLILPGGRSALAWGAAVALVCLLAWGIGLPTVSAFTPAFRLSQAQNFAEHALMGVIAFLVVAPAVVGDLSGGAVRAVLRARAAALLGLVSYSVFLWHGPIIQKLAKDGVLDWVGGASTVVLLAVTLAIVVPIAALSYYAVERPFLRLKHRRRRAPTRPAPVPQRS